MLGNGAAILAAAALVAIAIVHLYWAGGGRWPASDSRGLAEMVVGATPGNRMPGAVACAAVAVLLLVAAALLLSLRGFGSPQGPHWIVVVGVWIVAAVLGLRGVGGFFERSLRPQIVGLPYDRLNRTVYSPLCLCLAALVGAAAAFPD